MSRHDFKGFRPSQGGPKGFRPGMGGPQGLVGGPTATLPLIVRDQLGRPLSVGDGVLLQQPPNGRIFAVTSIAPVVDPNVPNAADLVEIQFKAVGRYFAGRNQPSNEFLRVSTVSEAEAANAAVKAQHDAMLRQEEGDPGPQEEETDGGPIPEVDPGLPDPERASEPLVAEPIVMGEQEHD